MQEASWEVAEFLEAGATSPLNFNLTLGQSISMSMSISWSCVTSGGEFFVSNEEGSDSKSEFTFRSLTFKSFLQNFNLISGDLTSTRWSLTRKSTFVTVNRPS